MLFGMLIDTDMATELVTALPLNKNGPASAGVNPFVVGGAVPDQIDGSLAVWSMLVQNFRAQIIVPTDAQYTTGASLNVLCFYFELAPPPPELNNITAKNFLTWTVPFENSIWSTGQVQFEHGGNLKVRIMWPLNLDAVSFCNFDGSLKVGCADFRPS